jgi:hypothetical protein
MPMPLPLLVQEVMLMEIKAVKVEFPKNKRKQPERIKGNNQACRS